MNVLDVEERTKYEDTAVQVKLYIENNKKEEERVVE